jgi:hypothetical protein
VRLQRARRTRILSVVAGAVALWSGQATAQQVTYEGSTWNLVSRATTLRIPATGTFTLRPVVGSFIAVGVGMSGVDYTVTSAAWNVAGTATRQRMEVLSSRTGTGCRTEMWGVAAPAAGDGYAEVTISPVSFAPPVPALGASLIAYGNVGSISTDGPCCMFISNDGSQSSTITKTFDGNNRYDYLAASVCIAWGGSDPGTPVPDYAANPALVPRMVQSVRLPNLYVLAVNSAGAAVDPPLTSTRHMRWVEGGIRDWATTGIILQPAAFAAPPPDAAPPPVDAPLPPDAQPLPADVAVDRPAPVDAPLRADTPPDQTSDAALFDSAPSVDPDAAVARRVSALRVGCACDVGARRRGSFLPILALLLLQRRRRRRDETGRVRF